MRFVDGQASPPGGKGTLDRWSLLRAPDGTVAVAGELGGGPFRTSAVRELDRDGRWVRTANSVYALGRHDPEAGARSGLAVDGPSAGWRPVPLPRRGAAGAAPTAGAAGFRTAQGSLYALDAEGRTTRLKLSSGRGSGEVHVASMALYVGPDDADLLMPLAIAIETLRIGSLDPATRVFSAFESRVEIPPGHLAAVVVLDRATGAFRRGCRARTEPAVGLTPVEKAYTLEGGERVGHTHVGNPVVELLDGARLEGAFAAAGRPVPGRLPAAGPAPR